MLSETVAQKQEDYIVFKTEGLEDSAVIYMLKGSELEAKDVIVLTADELEQIRKEAYDEGAEEDDGYDAGYDDGYQQGYEEGTAENEE